MFSFSTVSSFMYSLPSESSYFDVNIIRDKLLCNLGDSVGQFSMSVGVSGKVLYKKNRQSSLSEIIIC